MTNGQGGIEDGNKKGMRAEDNQLLRNIVKKYGYEPKEVSVHIKNWPEMHFMPGDHKFYLLYFHRKKTKEYKFYMGGSRWSDWVTGFIDNSKDARYACSEAWMIEELFNNSVSEQEFKVLWMSK